MIFYKVTNGNYTAGYFKEKTNAEKEIKLINELLVEFKAREDIDKVPCYMEEVITED